MLSRGNTHSRGDGKVVYHVVLVAYDGFNPGERERNTNQRPCSHRWKVRRQIHEG